jgi:hypothetical protein
LLYKNTTFPDSLFGVKSRAISRIKTNVMGLAGTSSLPTGDVAILYRIVAIQPKALPRQQTPDEAWSQITR